MIKQRNIAVCIILSLVTCGIYGLYWFVCMTDDTNRVANEQGTGGVVSLLLTLITCNIYGLFWAYKRGKLIDQAKSSRGIPSSDNAILYLILALFIPIVAWGLIQNELNKLA